MVTDRLAQTVRQQLGLGRLLCLGGTADGVWIAESAATAVLRAAAAVPGTGLRSVRLALTDPETTEEPAVPPPPSGFPPGPVRITADFAATADRPLPLSADRLRAALSRAAEELLGLPVAAIDLHATALLEEAEAATGTARQPEPEPPPDTTPDTGGVAGSVTGVPGVARLAPVLGGPDRAVHTTDSPAGRRLRIQLAVAAGHRVLDVARAARHAAMRASPDAAAVTILVTAVDG
jgi:hypothetical protein